MSPGLSCVFKEFLDSASRAQTAGARGKMGNQLGADGVQARDGGGLVGDSNGGEIKNGWMWGVF